LGLFEYLGAMASPYVAQGDQVLLFPRHGGVREWAAFVARLRALRLDATVDPQGNWKSGVVGLLSGAPGAGRRRFLLTRPPGAG